MSVESQNKKYLEGLMKKVTDAVTVYAQETVRETLTWLTVMTVQDSGNAAYNWRVQGESGSSIPLDLRGDGSSLVGDRGEFRRPITSISSSDTKGSLTGASAAVPEYVIGLAYSEISQLIMDPKSFTMNGMSIVNNISDLGTGYEYYQANALGLISQNEATLFGAQRGHEAAMKKGVVKRVT